MQLLSVLAVVGAALAVVVVVARFVRVKVRVLPHVTFRDLRALSAQTHALVGEYLRANWSGDPGTLGLAVRGLLPQVRNLAERHGPALDDTILRTLVASSIAAHHLARREAAEAAVDEALAPERRSA